MNRLPIFWALAALGLFILPSSRAQAPNITATQADSFTANGAGRATPGNNITYTITINNAAGAGTATNTKINNPTPLNTTLGTIQTTCLAINDAYTCTGNISITIPSGTGVLANDADPDNVGPAITATAISGGATEKGGTVTLNTNGSFTYNPPAGYTGADTFSYTLNDGEGNTDTAVVTITVSDMIWFIDANASSDGDGRLSNPFKFLASFQAINGDGLGNHPKDNQSVFLYESWDVVTPSGTDYSGGVTLRNGQRLIGQDATGTLAALSGVTLATGSAALPTFNATANKIVRLVSPANGVTLGSGNTLNGFTIGDTGATSNDITGTAVGSLNISNVSCIGTGGIIRVDTSGTLNVTLDSAVSTSSTNGVFLTGTTGTFTITTGAISGATGDDFVVTGGTVAVSSGATITNTAGRSVNISGKTTSGGVTFTGAISDTGAGILLDNNDGAVISFSGGLTLATTTNTAFSAVNGGTVNVTGATNTITTTTGNALNVNATTIGASGLTFRSISSNGATNGIVLNNTGGTGGLTVTGNGSAGTGGTIQNCSGHGISLANTAKVNLSWMNITNNLGSGISGGTINGFLLDRMSISGNGNDAATDESGINVTEVTGSAFNGANPTGITNSTISNNNEFEVQITNTTGNLTDFRLTNNTISSNGQPVNGNTPSPHGNLVNFLGLGTASMTLNASGGTFSGNITDPPLAGNAITATAIQADHSGTSGLVTANISGASFSNNNVAVSVSAANGGGIDFDVDGNTATANRSHALNLFVGANSTGLVTGSFTNNVVGTLGTDDSGSRIGFGIRVQMEAVATANPVTVLISGNTVQETESFSAINLNQGIVGQASTRTLNATITNNIIRQVDSGRAIVVQQNNGTNPTSAGITNLDVRGNVIDLATIVGQAGDGSTMRFRQLDANGGDMNIVQAAPTTSAIPGELDDANGFNEPGDTEAFPVLEISLSGSIDFSQAAPPLPLLFAPDFADDAGPPALDSVESAVAWAEATRQRSVATGQNPADSDPTLPVVDPADRTASGGPFVSAPLTQAQLDTLVAAAKERWIATGLSDEQRAALDTLAITVADLPGWYLGEAAGTTLRIDKDAGGNGWFVDETPEEDSEFEKAHQPSHRVDLLTTLMHEMGHTLGLCDHYEPLRRGSLMYGYLTAGERRLPKVGEARHAVPHTHTEPHYLGGDLVIGTLPPGKTITITYTANINPTPVTFTTISSQGTVTADDPDGGGPLLAPSVLTNDPATPAANDPTLTPVEQRPTLTGILKSTSEDTTMGFTAANFDAGFADVNAGDTLQTLRITSLPGSGTLLNNSVPITAGSLPMDIARANIPLLTYQPASNDNGVTTFSWSASDGNGFADATALVTITVNAVNDEPTLTAIPNPTAILEDATEQTVNLAGIGEGAANESAQTVTITAVSDNIALIPNPVAVDYTEGNATGAVRYTPTANAFGTAVITVTVQDSGGVTPGDDTITRQFTVVVNPVADTPSITNATTLPGTQTTSGLVVTRNAADGVEVTHVKVTNILNGSLFLANGTTAVPAGTFVPYSDANAGFKFTPAPAFQGDATFQIQASTSNVDGGLGGGVVTATVSVSERVSIDSTVALGDNDAAEGGVNNGLYTFKRGGSSGILVANFSLHGTSTATAADFSLAVVGSGSVSFAGSSGTVTFPDTVNTVTVALTAVAEAINAAEAAETVRFDIVPIPGTYLTGTPDNATVTIGQNGFTVTTTNDSGSGSLRQAVLNANAIAGTDTITFSDGTGGTVNFIDAVPDTVALTSGQLTISSNLSVLGSAAERVTLNGSGTSRVFEINPGASARLDGLTITNGGGVTHGGGIMNRGTLVVNGCAIVNNTASGLGAGGGGLSSGAVSESGAVTTVINSTFVGNSAVFGGGASNTSANSLTLINCTFSGNTATQGAGGGFSNSGSGWIFNSTFSGNNASVGGGGVWADNGTLSMGNALVAGNSATGGSPDLGRGFAGAVTSNGGNLIGNGQDTANAVTWVGTDLQGTTATPLDPLLGALANNGGPTQTRALLSGSPALNAGLAANVPADTFDLDGDTNVAEPIPYDQRGVGFLRAIGTVDIGAFELQKAVSITALDAVKAEGNGGGTTNYTFTVARTGDLADSVTLDWTVTGSGLNAATAADFAATTGQVTLNATEGSKVVNVVVNAEAIVEPAEGFTVTLSNPTNGYVVNGATADGTINNDDSATILLTGGTSKNEGNTGTTTYTFTATLSQPVQGGVSVAYTTNDGTATAGDNDYTDNDSSLSFPGSTAGEQRTFDVLVTGDNKVEASEDFTAVLGAVAGGHGSVTVTGSSQTGTITNDDSAVVAVAGNVSQLEGSSPQAFSITLSNPVDINVTVNFATSNGTAIEPGDYTASSGSATFVAGTTTAQVVNVAVANDSEFEGNESFNFTLSGLSAPLRSVTLGTSAAIGTIQNDDTLTISITATDDSADENTAATGAWRVSRNGTLGAVTANLEVDLTSTAVSADWTQSGASFVSMAPGGVGTVTIPDGQSFVDITLTPVADVAAEADETVQLNVAAGSGYTPSNSPTRTVTIARNDFGVTNVDDSGEGSLRQAVDNANVLAGSDTVTFEGPVFSDAVADTITLAGTRIQIVTPVVIQGPGADLLRVSGNNASRIFEVVTSSGAVRIEGLSLVDGHAIGAGNGGAGGAIFHFGSGSLFIQSCVLRDNLADTFAGAINHSNGLLEIRDSSLTGNTADSSGTGGGAIVSGGTLNIVNTSISGNSSPNATAGNGGGGGIVNFAQLNLSHSTITGNRTSVAAGGGGIDARGNETITHSIIAGNFVGTGTTPSDIGGGVVDTATYNLIGDAGTAGGMTDGNSGNLVGIAGTGTRDIATVLDPVLADNGGLTPTHKLVVGSPAIDAGDPAFDGSTFTPPLTNDQRGTGFTRLTKGLASSPAARIDIGAYELIAAPVFTNDDLEINTGSMPLDLSTASGVTPSGGTFTGTGVSGGFFDPTGLALGAYTVTYTVGDTNGTNSTSLTVTVTERPSLTVTSASDTVSKIDGQTSLREALAYAATLTGAQTVAFSNNTTGGAVNFHDAVPETILLGGTELEIIGNVTVDGPGAGLLAIDGNAASRVFNLPGLDPANEIILRGLTVANGAAISGAGLDVSDGILRVENCSFEGNVASSLGGAIESDAVTLDLIDTNFLNNEADEGGALALDSGGVCRRCHFEGNTSLEDGAAISFTDTGYVIAESTFTGNAATDEGGVIDNNGNDLLLLNCTLSGNTAGTAGGAINNQGGLTVVNSTITGNRADADGAELSPGTPDEGLGGGGIRTDDNRGVVTLFNTIVAGNRRGAPGSDVAADLSTALPADIGVDPASANNLIGDPGFVGELVHGVNGNIVGKEDGAGPRIEWPLSEILNPVLAANGGPTLTHSLAIGSPAIDGGANALALDEASLPLSTDQRGAGFVRITMGLVTSAAATVDLGAYELFAAPVFTEGNLRISVDGAPVNLAAATGVSPAGGVFSGPGVSGGFFDPKSQVPGVYTLTYTVTDAFGVSNSADFRVTVLSLPPDLTLTQPKRFKTTVVGTSSRSQRVYIRNVGGLPTKTLRVGVSGPARKDFIVTQPAARSLEAGDSTFFQVTFRPRAEANRKALVTVYSDSTPVSVKLQGRGQAKSGIRPPRAVK